MTFCSINFGEFTSVQWTFVHRTRNRYFDSFIKCSLQEPTRLLSQPSSVSAMYGRSCREKSPGEMAVMLRTCVASESDTQSWLLGMVQAAVDNAKHAKI